MANRDDEIISLLSKMSGDQRETNRAISELDKKVDLHIQKMEYELGRVNHQDAIQNQLLDQHIEGVNTLKKIHLEHVAQNSRQFAKVDKEIESLKEPAKWIRTTTKVVLWIGGIGTALMGVLEVVSWWKGH